MADYDVVADYSWTSVPTNSGLRDEAPYVFVSSFELAESQLRAFVSGYLNLTNAASQKDAMTFYKNLYKTKGSPTSFKFPYFEDNFRSYANNYADTFSQISQRGAQFLGAPTFEAAGGIVEEALVGGAALASQTQSEFVKQFTQKAADVSAAASTKLNPILGKLGNATRDAEGKTSYEFRIPAPGNPSDFPGTYIETPKFFQYANTDAALEVNFLLANTINENDVSMNQKLISEIIKESRPKRNTAIELSFPRIYEVEAPGLRFIKWAYLSNAAFNLVGARRVVDGKIVPEAYAISLSFQSLTLEPSNFLEEANMS